MNKNIRIRRNNNNDNGEDEVEQLLHAAQDDLLLKMSVDSHMSRVSPDYLLPDLDRRFQALKNRRPSNPVSSKPPTQSPSPSIVNNSIDDADLLARFAALKASSSSSTCSKSADALAGCNQDPVEDDEEDEVEKIIRWAKDAARLDPSPPSDNDDEDDADIIDDSDTTDNEEDDRVDKRKKGNCK